MRLTRRLLGIALAASLLGGPSSAQPSDPLPSWNDSGAKQAVVEFVGRITRPGPDFVPPGERVAVFDNDGAFLTEQPVWLNQVPYARSVDQPQLELLAYLRQAGFRTFVISGDAVRFMRAVAVVDARRRRGGVDDGPGKPVALQVGSLPVVAVGNSDGDQAMLQYTTSRNGPSLALLVHHDDAAREYAYDRASAVGKLDKALDEAQQRKWTIVSMKSDWRTIFPAN